MRIKNTYLFAMLSLLFFISVSGAKAASLPSFFLGNKNAPVTIYEFSSLSCPHCKNSFNILIPDNGKENPISNLIKNGKVKVVLMDTVIHGEKDIMAHSILYFSKTNAQFFNLVKMFMNNQENWFLADNTKEIIINYAKLSGMTTNVINSYENNKIIPNIIAKNSEHYIKDYGVDGTPVTIVEKSGQPITKASLKITGEFDIKELEKNINSLLK